MAVHPAVSRTGFVRACTVLLICLLCTTALAGPAFAASAGLEGDTAADALVSETTHDTDTIEIGEGLEKTSGTVEVVVRLEEATIPDTASETDAEEVLEEHAEATQEPLLEYATNTSGITIETEFWLTNAVLLEVDTDQVALEDFEEFTAVETVHKNFELSVPAEPDVNTTGSTSELADGAETAATTGQQSTPGIELLNAPAVWDAYETRGEGVRVAVLDTGIDATHPDLELYTEDPSDPTYPGGWAEFTATGERIANSEPYDSGTHGTHVSGTVAGGTASGTQIGVAPDVELLHGLVLNETSGSFAQIIAGMEWALEEEADVLSMSLGATGTHHQLIDPVQNAMESGTVVVAAIGNDGVETSSAPGNVHDTISVGAVYANGDVPPFSGGEQIERTEWHTAPESWPSSYTVPTVVAHGVSVMSTVPGGYQSMPGTSMATPHVSGAVALMLSTEPDATPQEISTALYETAWKPDGTIMNGSDIRYGHGIVDAKAATDALAMTRTTTDTTTADEDGSETEIETSSPVSRLVVASVSILVLAISIGALLAARSLARERDP